MAIHKKLFVVFAADNPSALADSLSREFPDLHLNVGVGQWLLVAELTTTTVEVCKKLGVLIGDDVPYVSSAIVASAGNYFGSAPGATWEWIAAKMGGSDAAG